METDFIPDLICVPCKAPLDVDTLVFDEAQQKFLCPLCGEDPFKEE